jgi:hypothetical protein
VCVQCLHMLVCIAVPVFLHRAPQPLRLYNSHQLHAASQPSALPLQAYSQRSDHLAAVAAYNGWVAARAAGGRGAAAEFARQHFVSEQVRKTVRGAAVTAVCLCTLLCRSGYEM